jgi:hypothetical protein
MKKVLPEGNIAYPIKQSVLLLNSINTGIEIEGWFILETDRQARAFAVMIKIMLLSEARRKGDDAIAELIGNAVIRADGNRVTVDGVVLETAAVQGIMTGMLNGGIQ